MFVFRACFQHGYLETIAPHRYPLSVFGMTSWTADMPVGNELTWTISTMFFFYLCFPALAPRMQRVQNLRGLAWSMWGLQISMMIVGMLLLGAVSPERGYWIRAVPPIRIPIFIMGMCCGLEFVHSEQARLANNIGVEPGSASPDLSRNNQDFGGCACCCARMPADALAIIWLSCSLVCTVITFLYSCAVMLRLLLEILYPILFYDWLFQVVNPLQSGSFVVRFFRTRFMRFLGDLSLGAYMIHMILAELFGYAVNARVGQLPPYTVLVIVPLSIGFGWILTKFFEEPLANCIRPERKNANRVKVNPNVQEGTGDVTVGQPIGVAREPTTSPIVATD